MKFGHVEVYPLGGNPATWRWRLRGEMLSDSTTVVVVAVGLSALISGALSLYVAWYLETHFTRKR